MTGPLLILPLWIQQAKPDLTWAPSLNNNLGDRTKICVGSRLGVLCNWVRGFANCRFMALLSLGVSHTYLAKRSKINFYARNRVREILNAIQLFALAVARVAFPAQFRMIFNSNFGFSVELAQVITKNPTANQTKINRVGINQPRRTLMM